MQQKNVVLEQVVLIHCDARNSKIACSCAQEISYSSQVTTSF
jgi:hypothetical protein